MTDLTKLNPGDRVRLTLEGEVCSTVVGHEIAFKLDGAVFATTKLATTELTAPTARVELLPPPVDPDLLLAREWLKTLWPSVPHSKIYAGDYDRHGETVGYLAGIKAAKAGGKA